MNYQRSVLVLFLAFCLAALAGCACGSCTDNEEQANSDSDEGGEETDAQKVCAKLFVLHQSRQDEKSPAWMEKHLKPTFIKGCQTKAGELLDAAKNRDEVIGCFDKAQEPSDIAKCDAQLTGEEVAAAEFEGCPGSTECLNGCKTKCEKEHGALVDWDEVKDCIKAGKKPEECSGTNPPAVRCFRTCRGLSAEP